MDVKLFVSDLDGTLTDGIYQVNEDGKISKNFYTRDFAALEKLMEAGIQVWIITNSCDDVLPMRLNGLMKYNHDIWNDVWTSQNVKNKKEHIEKHLKDLGYSWENVAYIGDAENDIECIKAAGFSGCPSDAIEELVGPRNISRKQWNMIPTDEACKIINSKARFTAKYSGGRGAVYDFAMEVLKIKDE